MASISTDKAGNRKIQFGDGNGQRKIVRIGKASKKDADVILAKIEAILETKLSCRSLASEVAIWIGEIPDVLAKRMAAVGLIAPREKRQRMPRSSASSSTPISSVERTSSRELALVFCRSAATLWNTSARTSRSATSHRAMPTNGDAGCSLVKRSSATTPSADVPDERNNSSERLNASESSPRTRSPTCEIAPSERTRRGNTFCPSKTPPKSWPRVLTTNGV